MGTNFYARIDACEHCGRTNDEVHIGKSSIGWTFSFHGTTDIKSFKEWIKFLSKDNIRIFDEYDKEKTLDWFIKFVESKKTEKFNHTIETKKAYTRLHGCYLDEEGHSFNSSEFS